MTRLIPTMLMTALAILLLVGAPAPRAARAATPDGTPVAQTAYHRPHHRHHHSRQRHHYGNHSRYRS